MGEVERLFDRVLDWTKVLEVLIDPLEVNATRERDTSFDGSWCPVLRRLGEVGGEYWLGWRDVEPFIDMTDGRGTGDMTWPDWFGGRQGSGTISLVRSLYNRRSSTKLLRTDVDNGVCSMVSHEKDKKERWGLPSL